MRAGFVALAGRPNVGKSTLLNAVLGQKLAIATPRPQTTRNRILGVHNRPDAQVVFVDTPGLHRPSGRGRTRLNQFMVTEALSALDDVDAIVLLVDATDSKLDSGQKYVLDELKQRRKPVILAYNKIDLVRRKSTMLPMLEAYSRAFDFAALVPISAATGLGVDRLLEEIEKLLPEGDAIFPADMLTDRPERFIAAEFIREQVFLRTRQEVPYAVAVSIDSWTERPEQPPRKGQPGRSADLVIEATIHVEKEAQKKILVGQGGQSIREIGTRARAEIAQLVGCPVHLKLFVRVEEDWTSSRRALAELGYA